MGMADRIIEMRAVADMPGSSMRVSADDCTRIVGIIDAQAAEIERLKLRLKNILEAPSETLSDSKALKEMVRQAKLGLDGK
jgi:hypothetical protein